MAARGRKPKPTALRCWRAIRQRPLNDHEPIPPKGELKCPSWLLPEAKKEWKRLASSLEAMGVLTVADLTAFAGLLSGVCTMERGRGIHHPAWQHL